MLRYRHSVWTASDDCLLEDVFVEEQARGTGLGRALVEFALDLARERGCRRAELDVNEANEPALRSTSRSASGRRRRPGRGATSS